MRGLSHLDRVKLFAYLGVPENSEQQAKQQIAMLAVCLRDENGDPIVPLEEYEEVFSDWPTSVSDRLLLEISKLSAFDAEALSKDLEETEKNLETASSSASLFN